jgi:hypothetical protein
MKVSNKNRKKAATVMLNQGPAPISITECMVLVSTVLVAIALGLMFVI